MSGADSSPYSKGGGGRQAQLGDRIPGDNNYKDCLRFIGAAFGVRFLEMTANVLAREGSPLLPTANGASSPNFFLQSFCV